MPKLTNLSKHENVSMFLPQQHTCACHENDPPPWTGEIHGLSQALMSETLPMRAFWWLVMAVCIICGTTTTALVVMEYIQGPTATSTTIRLVDSLQFPAVTICPKVPDSFNESAILADIGGVLPQLSPVLRLDLIRYFVGGNGLENIDDLMAYNRTYLNQLDSYYKIWSKGYTTDEFFKLIHDKYGYKCEDLFHECELGGRILNCCEEVFKRRIVMRRGICYQTNRGVNQTEADDIGRMILSLKAPNSITSKQFNYTQPQIVVYVTDNFDRVVDFPRFYLYPQEWNRMRFTARYIDLIENPDVCTNKIFGKDADCVVRKWLLSNIVLPFNCTLSYMTDVPKIPPHNGICPLSTIVDNYYNNIQLVWNSAAVKEECTPGCRRWDYQTSLQQSQTLGPFEDFIFNLEISFSDLQYEYVKEVFTTSVPGFMSQIGGQFGFFLGLSIITFVQMILYGIHFIATKLYEKTNKVYRTFSSLTARQKPKTEIPETENAADQDNEDVPKSYNLNGGIRTQAERVDTYTVRSSSWQLKDASARVFPE